MRDAMPPMREIQRVAWHEHPTLMKLFIFFTVDAGDIAPEINAEVRPANCNAFPEATNSIGAYWLTFLEQQRWRSFLAK